MRTPCVAILDTATALLEFGVLEEAAHRLADLRRCAQEGGCGDWHNCNCQIEDAWHQRTHPAPKPNPEALARQRS